MWFILVLFLVLLGLIFFVALEKDKVSINLERIGKEKVDKAKKKEDSQPKQKGTIDQLEL